MQDRKLKMAVFVLLILCSVYVAQSIANRAGITQRLFIYLQTKQCSDDWRKGWLVGYRKGSNADLPIAPWEAPRTGLSCQGSWREGYDDGNSEGLMASVECSERRRIGYGAGYMKATGILAGEVPLNGLCRGGWEEGYQADIAGVVCFRAVT